MSHTSHDMSGHKQHIREFKRKFWISIMFTVPILLLSETIQTWFGFTLETPFQKEILFLLSLVIYVYGGLPFLRGTVNELQKRQPGMMTLIGTAISVAFFFSTATTFFMRAHQKGIIRGS
jgi:Cu2+-exporting ATPase